MNTEGTSIRPERAKLMYTLLPKSLTLMART